MVLTRLPPALRLVRLPWDPDKACPFHLVNVPASAGLPLVSCNLLQKPVHVTWPSGHLLCGSSNILDFADHIVCTDFSVGLQNSFVDLWHILRGHRAERPVPFLLL